MKDIMIIKIGWITSFWSDFQTFGFILASFAVNEHFLNSNNFVDFSLVVMLVFLCLIRSTTSKFVKKFKTKEEAIKYLTEEE